jgi:hypothetical protein
VKSHKSRANKSEKIQMRNVKGDRKCWTNDRRSRRLIAGFSSVQKWKVLELKINVQRFRDDRKLGLIIQCEVKLASSNNYCFCI